MPVPEPLLIAALGGGALGAFAYVLGVKWQTLGVLLLLLIALQTLPQQFYRALTDDVDEIFTREFVTVVTLRLVFAAVAVVFAAVAVVFAGVIERHCKTGDCP